MVACVLRPPENGLTDSDWIGSAYVDGRKRSERNGNMMRNALSWRNAWRIRIVVLSILVIGLGAGSQVLVHAFASGTGMSGVIVSASAREGIMAGGNWTYKGACAVSTAQFPLGTVLDLYNSDGSFNQTCTAEDTTDTIPYGHIHLLLPGDRSAADAWGVRSLLVHPERWGWDNDGPAPQAVVPSGSSLASSGPTQPIRRHHPLI